MRLDRCVLTVGSLLGVRGGGGDGQTDPAKGETRGQTC